MSFSSLDQTILLTAILYKVWHIITEWIKHIWIAEQLYSIQKWTTKNILYVLKFSRLLEQIPTVEKGSKTFFSKLMCTQCSSAFSRKSLQTQRFRTANVKFYQSTSSFINIYIYRFLTYNPFSAFDAFLAERNQQKDSLNLTNQDNGPVYLSLNASQ